MPRRMLRRYLPEHSDISGHWLLKHAGAVLGQPGLWHLNRRSVARATGVGLCVAFLPVPQTLTVVLLAVWLRFNLPVAIALVLLTNPLILAPLFYMNCLVGSWLLSTPLQPAPGELTLGWLLDQIDSIWLPLYTGSLVVDTTLGLLGMLLVDHTWRIHVRWRRRKKPHMRHL